MKPLVNANNLLKFLFLLDQKLKKCLAIEKDVDKTIAIITQTILEVFDKFAPVKKCTAKNKKHWLTKEVVVACRRRDEAHKKCFQNHLSRIVKTSENRKILRNQPRGMLFEIFMIQR